MSILCSRYSPQIIRRGNILNIKDSLVFRRVNTEGGLTKTAGA